MQFLLIFFFIVIFIILIWLIKILILPLILIGLVFYFIKKIFFKPISNPQYQSYSKPHQNERKNDNIIDVEYQEKYED